MRNRPYRIWRVQVMSEKGIRIPEEVSVVGFGDYEAGELLQPPLTTVN